MDKHLGTSEIARLANVSPRTAAKWIDQNELPGWKLPGSKVRRAKLSTLITFLAKHGMPPIDLSQLDAAAA